MCVLLIKEGFELHHMSFSAAVHIIFSRRIVVLLLLLLRRGATRGGADDDLFLDTSNRSRHFLLCCTIDIYIPFFLKSQLQCRGHMQQEVLFESEATMKRRHDDVDNKKL